MDNLFELNAVDDILLEGFANTDSFNEFSHCLDMIDRMYSEPILEEVIDTKQTFKRKVGKIVHNTVDTTKGVAKAYDQVTDSQANLIKSSWDLMMQGISLLVKITSFIVNQIAKVPKFIIKVLNKVSQIPVNIRNKIQGNIQLYITANDIENLYNQSLLSRIESFIRYGAELSKGDAWNTTFNGARISLNNGSPIKLNPNDITYCKEMKKIYNALQHLNFTQTTISMKNQGVINTYFGDEKSISYSWGGKQYTSNYYEALKQLIDILSTQKDSIKKIQDSINVKLNDSYSNSNFVKLDSKSQNTIKDAVQQITKVTGIVGNIIKYIIQDMKVISQTTDSIIAKSASETKKLQKK